MRQQVQSGWQSESKRSWSVVFVCMIDDRYVDICIDERRRVSSRRGDLNNDGL